MMTWNPQANELFLQALQLSSTGEQQAYLDRACAGDTALRAEVQALLDAGAQAGDFLEAPVAAAELAATSEAPILECPGAVIGPYKLLEQIGEGGFGMVFMAEQTEPVQRKVALKVLKPGMDTRQVSARFEAERQALAMMDHPNIARVLDAGQTHTGRPYFVMDLVKGLPITDYCDQAQLTTRDRLAIFVSVCEAVQHAHHKGIIHRDLKPTNVLVTVQDGRALVKVIDFGIAKALGQQLTDKTLFTGFAQLIGTPLYMSPEQAALSNVDVDTRSDVYSLGVLLYELLTGTTPFARERLREADYDEWRRIIREEEPPKPSTRISTLGQAATTVSTQRQSDPRRLSQLFRGELDWIVMKALEKDRSRRYDSASAFAADVQRYLCDEPVLACPPRFGYRLRKFAHRNKGRLLAGGALALALLVVVAALGLLALDRLTRRTKAANALALALERAELLHNRGKGAEALATIHEAELLANEAAADPVGSTRLAALKEELVADAHDQEFLTRFQEIRLRVESQVDVRVSNFARAAALSDIRDALRRYGITISSLEPVQAAARIQARPEAVRGQVVTALDECLMWTPRDDQATRQWLLAALALADQDAWRTQARTAMARRDWQTLEALTRSVEVSKQPPSFLLIAAANLPARLKSARLKLLHRTQRAHPADLWANLELAELLMKNNRPAESIHYFTAALTLRPDNAGIYLNRGLAFDRIGDVDQAIEDDRQAVALAPQYAMAHCNLGLALWHKHHIDEAIKEYQEALRLKNDFPEVHLNLGLVLMDKGQLDGAISEYHEAIRLKPDFAEAHYCLGIALRTKGDLPGAIVECRKAIAVRPEYGQAHWNLGQGLREQGVYREALAELRRARQIGGIHLRSPKSVDQLIQQCERQVALEARLPAFIAGRITPVSAVERIELAEMCALKRLHHAAARFYENAFAVQPGLADEPGTPHRYNAVCAAVQAGCGQGQNADKLNDHERSRLRRQALDWLRAELRASSHRLDSEAASGRSPALVCDQLKDWLTDSDLAGVREPTALTKLPEAERRAWLQLWKDVRATSALAQAKLMPRNASHVK